MLMALSNNSSVHYVLESCCISRSVTYPKCVYKPKVLAYQYTYHCYIIIIITSQYILLLLSSTLQLYRSTRKNQDQQESMLLFA